MMMAGDACGSMMLGDNSPPSCLETQNNKGLASRALVSCLLLNASATSPSIYDHLGLLSECDSSECDSPLTHPIPPCAGRYYGACYWGSDTLTLLLCDLFFGVVRGL